ncbi:MAG: hypothetical protein EXS15_04935 [Phycisphaerales bacterium]|nr:hypothetical protein [Phycisphaerales bacterium]
MHISSRLILCSVLAVATGCSTPPAVPVEFNIPTIAATQVPVARNAILKYARKHQGSLPDTSNGEQITLRSVKTFSRTGQEMDSAESLVQIEEHIDGLAYAYRPAQTTFVIAVAGRVIRTPVGGGEGSCAWFCFQGRYDDKGVINMDLTTYHENAELFVDAMRSTTHRTGWNSSAWAITKCNFAVRAARGASEADAMVDRFVMDAIATGRARVPDGMPPRQAAFGGVPQAPATSVPAPR